MKIDYPEMMREAFSNEKEPVKYPAYGCINIERFPPSTRDLRFGFFGFTDSKLLILILSRLGACIETRIEIPLSDINVTEMRKKWLAYEIRFKYRDDHGKKRELKIGLYKRVRFAEFKDQPENSAMLYRYFGILWNNG